MPNSSRRALTRSARPMPVSSAISSSVNPIVFAVRNKRALRTSALRRSSSTRMIRCNARVNQTSTPVSRVNLSGLSPVRSLNINFHKRVSSPPKSTSCALPKRHSGSSQVSDRRPSSNDLTAFTKAASKLRSIAITSPVAFICVPSDLSPVSNLSNGQRGIFTTQ